MAALVSRDGTKRAYGSAGTGLVLGGLLTQYRNWHWTLYISTPPALAAGLGAAFILPASQVRRARLDVLGAALATAGLVVSYYLRTIVGYGALRAGAVFLPSAAPLSWPPPPSARS